MSKDSQDKKYTSRGDVLDATLEKYYAAAENANNPDDDNEVVEIGDNESIPLGELRNRINQLENEKKSGVVTEETISITPDGDEFEKSYKEKYKGLLKEEYPDDDYSDDEAIFKRAIENNTSRKDIKKLLDQSNAKNKELNDLLDDDPRLGALLSEVYSGASVPYALGRYFSKEELFPEDAELSDEEYEKGRKEREERIKSRNDERARWEDNLKKNEETFSKFAKGKNFDDAKTKDFFGKISSTLGSVKEGLVPEELLDFLYNGYNYDNDMEIARKAGEVDGRNQKIEVTRRTFKDDYPTLGGKGITGDDEKDGKKYAKMIEDINKRSFWKNSK